MLDEDFLRVARTQFAIVGPAVSEEVILSVFPDPFPGRDDLVQFYLQMNGGGRTERSCLIFCGNPEHKVSRNDLDNIRIECFQSIFKTVEERVLPFASMLRHHATMKRIYAEVPEMTAFLTEHIAIAKDHSGRDLCISRQSGSVLFMNWEEYKLGSVEVASSFSDFLARFWNVGPGEDFPRQDC
jgi:hypothetical protein